MTREDQQSGIMTIVRFSDGDAIAAAIAAAANGTRVFRVLFLPGSPFRESIAWMGPIVMNTDAELREAFREYRDGTFITNR